MIDHQNMHYIWQNIWPDGLSEGDCVGVFVGELEGALEGKFDGELVGELEGLIVGESNKIHRFLQNQNLHTIISLKTNTYSMDFWKAIYWENL